MALFLNFVTLSFFFVDGAMNLSLIFRKINTRIGRVLYYCFILYNYDNIHCIVYFHIYFVC